MKGQTCSVPSGYATIKTAVISDSACAVVDKSDICYNGISSLLCGGGIYLRDTAQIRDTTLAYNQANRGGGLCVDGGTAGVCRLTIAGSRPRH